MKNSILILIVSLFSIPAMAQMPGAGRMSGQNMNVGHFYGKIIDGATNKPVEGVSIQLIQNKLDTAIKKRRDFIVSGMLTDKKGEFSLENLPIMATYKLKITAMGYKTIEQKAFFEMKPGGDMTTMLSGVDKDLGNIKIETDAQQLAEVNLTGSRGMLQLGIDRKVFNVDRSLTSVGGTAVDVMKNVPSVNVDIDGNVSLRNAAPQIFVDGRPSTLSLDQIPADAIQSIEIVTNPSAKFDASGGGSGILNIVLKKARKTGYNGSIRASIDSRGKPSGGGDINVRQGKVNVFANTMVHTRKSLSEVSSERQDFLNNNTTATLKQINAPVNKGMFMFGRAGIDYLVDIRNTITLAGSMARGNFNNDDITNITRDTNYISSHTTENGIQNTDAKFSFRNYGTTLSYKHNFAKAGKELTADANYNLSKNTNEGLYNTQYFYSNRNPKGPMQMSQSMGGGTTKFLTVQTDFVNPITDKMKMEMGVRGAFRNYNSTSNNLFFDPA